MCLFIEPSFIAGALAAAVPLAALAARGGEGGGAPADPGGSPAPDGFAAGQTPLTSAEWLRLIVRQVPSVIWTADTELRLNYIAGGDAHTLMYQPEKYIGKSLPVVLGADEVDATPLRAHLDALEGRSGRYTYRQERRGREFDVRVEPLRDEGGAIIGCLGLAVEVTSQRQAERALRSVQVELDRLSEERASALAASNERLRQEVEERQRAEARYRGIVESQQDLVVRVDTEGRFTFVNDAYCRKFGKQREELIGSKFAPLIHPDDLAGTLEAMTHLGDPPHRVTMEQRALTVDGWRWIAWEDYAIRDDEGNIVEIQGVGRDVTARVETSAAEREQRALAEALRDTASVINSTLELDEVLERILANVGHVVRHNAANLMLTDAGGRTRVVRARGYEQHNLHERVMSADFSLHTVREFQRMAETRQPLLVPDTREDPEWVDLQGSAWVRSYAGAPITIEGDLLGFLNLDSSEPNAFTAEDTERLMAFADQAAIAIRNARLYEQAQELAAMEAAMEERQRIARELHDAVSQSLFSASVIAQSLPRLWELDIEEVRDALDELNRLTRGALAEMRTLLLELRPMDLIDVTLDDLLQQLVDAFAGKSSASITLHIEGRHKLTPEVRIALYRITQEALNNVVKHARASAASVNLHSTAEGTALRVVDNGRGFDPSAVPPQRMGLQIMQERADLIGATLQVNSREGEGTEVRVTWIDPRGEETR